MDEGLCRDQDPKLWFPSGSGSKRKHDKGIRICLRCPVMDRCRQYAIENEAYGTWGGLDEIDRELYRAENGLPLLMTRKDRSKVARLKDL